MIGSTDYRDSGLQFPPGFLVGTATAAYQIEGSITVDGRGESIWDSFCRRPGAIAGGDSGEVAADHYQRYIEDVDLMHGLGYSAYRFSVAWPRIQPLGVGRPNEAGLDFYDRLTDALVERGIAPLVTLYHWDLPQSLEDQGGWTERSTAYHFADYAALVAQRLGDRVHTVTTLNEPWVSAFIGYGSGRHAPGRTGPETALRAVHHLNLAHGLGVSAMRSARTGTTPQHSVTLNLHAIRGADSTSPEAIRRIDGISNRVFLGPMLRGEYPSDVLADTAHLTDWSFVQSGDLADINQPIDVLGLNYYSTVTVRMGSKSNPQVSDEWPGSETVEFLPQPGPHTAIGANIAPEALEELLVKISEDYPGLPLMITETGAAYDDELVLGTIDDPERIDFLQRHFTAAHRALERGVDIQGVMVWSFMDNFEWAHGYAMRFGLIHIDYATLKRTVKASGHWLSELARTRVIPDALPRRATQFDADAANGSTQ